jgi:hypothetical protein
MEGFCAFWNELANGSFSHGAFFSSGRQGLDINETIFD